MSSHGHRPTHPPGTKANQSRCQGSVLVRRGRTERQRRPAHPGSTRSAALWRRPSASRAPTSTAGVFTLWRGASAACGRWRSSPTGLVAPGHGCANREFTGSSRIFGGAEKTASELPRCWCAVLGLNQSRLAKRRGRFRLICYLRTFVVTWTLADLAGRTCPAKQRERRRRIR
jgi:hypothetical protein